MKLLRSLIIAFSSYSKIPMPQFAWKESDMKYIMAFFPLIGVVIGGLEYGWFLAAASINTGSIAYCLVAAVLPVLITGGYHVDGFMDTSDAVSSYRDREERLRILKDSHVGAFAVIRLLVAAGIFLAAISVFRSAAAVLAFSAGFVLSRSLSALAVLHFASATRKGSLFYTASNSQRKINTIVCSLEAAAAAAVMILAFPLAGALGVAASLAAFGYYRIMSSRKFGGITGDLAGYFVVICEIAMAVAVAAGELICG